MQIDHSRFTHQFVLLGDGHHYNSKSTLSLKHALLQGFPNFFHSRTHVDKNNLSQDPPK